MRVEEAAQALDCNKREVRNFPCLQPIVHCGRHYYNRAQVEAHIQRISLGLGCGGECQSAIAAASPSPVRQYKRNGLRGI
jgi:hypothetical protein